METLELSCKNINEFKDEIAKIPQDQWKSTGLIYGPTEIPGMYQIYRDDRCLSQAKLVNYQELHHLKTAYESNHEL